MNNVPRMIYKITAVIFFLLAVASVLAILFAAPGASQSPGLFLAVALAGLGKLLLGKSQGKSAQETFGRAIDVVETGDTLETPGDPDNEIETPRRDTADRIGDGDKKIGSV